MKRCSTCKHDKPPTSFNARSRSKDGLSGMCRDCHKACRGRRKKHSLVCKSCNKVFVVLDRNRAFCSIKCSALYKSLQQRGEANPNWRGGIHISTKGYWYVRKPDHPRATNNGYVKRADLVAEETRGGPLVQGEEVHHKNFCKSDDRPENLEVLTREEHARLHGVVRRKPRRSALQRRSIKWPPTKELQSRLRTRSLREVAEELGCSHVAVWKRIRVCERQ